jgi:hypothetical protein
MENEISPRENEKIPMRGKALNPLSFHHFHRRNLKSGRVFIGELPRGE